MRIITVSYLESFSSDEGRETIAIQRLQCSNIGNWGEDSSAGLQNTGHSSHDVIDYRRLHSAMLKDVRLSLMYRHINRDQQRSPVGNVGRLELQKALLKFSELPIQAEPRAVNSSLLVSTRMS